MPRFQPSVAGDGVFIFIAVIMQKENTVYGDRQLIEQFKGGDKGALEKLFIKYKPKIHYFISKIIGNSDEAEDIAQDTLLATYQKLNNFTLLGKASFKTWLYRIARNLSKKYLRDKERREYPLIPLGEEKAIMSENPLDGLIAKEQRDVVRKAIPQLPEKQQQVLTLRTYEELSYKEIVQKIGGTEEAARKNYQRAINNLREKIK